MSPDERDSGSKPDPLTRPDRQRFSRAYLTLFEEVGSILDRYDPMAAISSGAPAGEYEPEVSTILPRLREAAGPDDALRFVNEEFEKWFGQAASDSAELGLEIWAAWQRYLTESDPTRARAR
jgi:hypothetical protein